MYDNEYYMKYAIEAAKTSGEDLPVGAVIVRQNEIIASAHNEKEAKNNSILHAEINALQIAQKKLGTWRLNDCIMYVTLEPCPMCAWAVIQSRINTLYFGAYDLKYGALGSMLDLRQIANSNLIVKGGICEQECSDLLKKYMSEMRKKNL